MVKVRIEVRFKVQKYYGFDPLLHSEPFIWETYRYFLSLHRSVLARARNRAILVKQYRYIIYIEKGHFLGKSEPP